MERDRESEGKVREEKRSDAETEIVCGGARGGGQMRERERESWQASNNIYSRTMPLQRSTCTNSTCCQIKQKQIKQLQNLQLTLLYAQGSLHKSTERTRKGRTTSLSLA